MFNAELSQERYSSYRLRLEIPGGVDRAKADQTNVLPLTSLAHYCWAKPDHEKLKFSHPTISIGTAAVEWFLIMKLLSVQL